LTDAQSSRSSLAQSQKKRSAKPGERLRPDAGLAKQTGKLFVTFAESRTIGLSPRFTGALARDSATKTGREVMAIRLRKGVFYMRNATCIETPYPL